MKILFRWLILVVALCVMQANPAAADSSRLSTQEAQAPQTPAQASQTQPQASQEQDSQTPAQAAPDSPYTLEIDPTLVSVDVLVTDEDGRVLGGLKQGNFRIFDEGNAREISKFDPTNTPITIVMLMEYSSSSYNYFANKAAVWGAGFLNHLEPQDWVALVTYDIKSKVQADFTHNLAQVRDTLTHLGFPGFRDANVYDAVIETLENLEKVHGRKAILLLSTGTNSFSSSSLDDVLNQLKRSDATIFTVGLAEEEYVRYGGADITYAQSRSFLNTVAERSGGMAFFPRFQGALPDVFRTVSTFLRNEYTLSFSPPKASRDGKYHRLRVEVVGQDGKPLKVTDAKGRLRKIKVYARAGYTARKEKALAE